MVMTPRRRAQRKKRLKKILDEEKRWLIRSYLSFDNLKDYIKRKLEKQRVGITEKNRKIEGLMEKITNLLGDLEIIHKQVLIKFDESKKTSPMYAVQIRLIENRIANLKSDIGIETGRLETKIRSLLKGGGNKEKDWEEVEKIFIGRIEADIERWMALDKQLESLNEGNWLTNLFKRRPKMKPAAA